MHYLKTSTHKVLSTKTVENQGNHDATGQSKQYIWAVGRIWASQSISIKVKVRFYEALILAVLHYWRRNMANKA